MLEKTVFTIILAIVTFFAGEAEAHIMIGNQRLDHLFYASDVPRIVVAGQIISKTVVWPAGSKEREVVTAGWADVSFRFAVGTVIFGEPKYRGETLVIPASHFDWPTELVPFEEGARCALILRTDGGENRDELDLEAVVPAGSVYLPIAQHSEEAKRILATEILRELKKEASAGRQRELILELAPILPRSESDVVLPFLKSDNVWLRRAALAGLLYTTKDAEYFAMAHEDIQKFIQTSGSSDLIAGPDGRRAYAPYPLLFSHYFFLQVGWSPEETAAAAAYLPLFRFLAQNKELPEWVRWEHGVQPLCRVGTREDAKFLYHYCGNREGKEKKEILQNASYRQAIIVAISRILGLELPNWVEEQFVEKEQEQHQAISNALVREGIITKEEIHDHPR